MAVAATVQSRVKYPRGLKAIVGLVFSGNYPAGGEPLDFAPLVGFVNRQPKRVEVDGIGGFQYSYDIAGKLLIVRCNTAGGADAPLAVHSTGAYAGGVTGDTVTATVYVE